MVVCTRFEQEIGRKPGTGAGKWSSVPDLSRKSDGNRVQERKVPSVPLWSSMEEGEASRQLRKVEMEIRLWYSDSGGVDK